MLAKAGSVPVCQGQPVVLPRLHLLKLHENPVQNGDYERYDLQWILKQNVSAEVVVAPGDVLLLLDLVTGAGEFEGMRFVGPYEDAEEKDGGRSTCRRLPLLCGGVEYPEFPAFVLSLFPAGDGNLRKAYGKLFDMMLQKVGGGPASLEEVMGDDTVAVDEFWASPSTLREKDKTGQWEIPPDKCTLLDTVDFPFPVED